MECIQIKTKVAVESTKIAELCGEGWSVRDALTVVETESVRDPKVILRGFYRHYKVVDQYLPLKTLSAEEESILVALLYAFSRNDCALSAQDVIKAVSLAFAKDVSPTWVSRFWKRHTDVLNFRKSVYLGKSRAKHERMLLDSQGYADEVLQYSKTHHMTAKNTVNYDECRLTIASDSWKVSLKRIEAKEKKKSHHTGSIGAATSVTFIPFISAEANPITMHVICKQGKKIVMPKAIHSMPCPIFIYTSHTGYADGDLFAKVLDDFRNTWKLHYPGLHCFVFGDNLASHKSTDILASGLRDGFHHIFFPPGTTHWSQPLDNLLFGRLKSDLRLQVEHFKTLSFFTKSGVLRFSFILYLMERANIVFTKEVVQASFRTCGVFPFDAEIIKKLAEGHHAAKAIEVKNTLLERTAQALRAIQGSYHREAEREQARVVTVSLRARCHSTPVLELHRRHLLKLQEEEEAKRKQLEKEDQVQKRNEAQLEKAKEKEEKKRKRIEAQHEAAEKRRKLDEEAVKAKEINTCKAGCGRTCRKGSDWLGCCYCDVYWMCPACYCIPSKKGQMTKHENNCKKSMV
tara:strand:- start:183 stop:1904 length:1722 start_codon:yes stop_codon:yes gene_type:complete